MLCTREIVDQGVEMPIVSEVNYVKNSGKKFESNQVWVPVPQNDESAKSNMPYLYLQQPSGYQAPRLINSGRGKNSM